MSRCPRCEVDLNQLDSGSAWICPSCDGLLLRELDPYMKMSEEELRDSAVQESLFSDHPKVNLDPPVACPQCNQTMRRFVYGNDSGIMLDSCPSGHGIWLDDGELARIYDYMHGIGQASKEDKVAAVMQDIPKLSEALGPPSVAAIPDDGALAGEVFNPSPPSFLKPPQRPS